MFILSVILAQVLIFIGLIYSFRRILTKNVTLATRHLEELNKGYEKKGEETNRRLEEAKEGSEKMLFNAQGKAEQKKAQIIKDAEAQRDKILKDARIQGEATIQQADKSRGLLISELEERIARQAIDKACELIQKALPEQFKQSVHSQWIEELIENGFNQDQLEALPIQEKIQEVKIASAFPLDDGQRKNLSRKIKELLKHDITLKEEVDSKIVAGIIVSIGSLVLDGSFKNKIEKQAQDMGTKKAA